MLATNGRILVPTTERPPQMVIPALSFLRLLGASIGPIAWVAFGLAVVWFVRAIRHAPVDGPSNSPDAPAANVRPHGRAS